jgi:hypothetical protein
MSVSQIPFQISMEVKVSRKNVINRMITRLRLNKLTIEFIAALIYFDVLKLVSLITRLL